MSFKTSITQDRHSIRFDYCNRLQTVQPNGLFTVGSSRKVTGRRVSLPQWRAQMKGHLEVALVFLLQQKSSTATLVVIGNKELLKWNVYFDGTLTNGQSQSAKWWGTLGLSQLQWTKWTKHIGHLHLNVKLQSS